MASCRFWEDAGGFLISKRGPPNRESIKSDTDQHLAYGLKHDRI